MVPPVFTVSANGPFTVWAKVIALLPVSVRRVLFPSVTASLYVWPPVVFTLPPLIAVVPAKSVVTLVRPPSFLLNAPPKVVVPPVFTVSVNGPFTVWAKVIRALLRCR